MHDHDHNPPRDDVRGRQGGGGCGGRLERGALRYIMLDALRDGPKHGYEIIRTLRDRTQGRYAPSPGRVYPILQLLTDEELIRCDARDERRVYSLTDTGVTELAANADRVAEFWSGFTLPASSEPVRHEAEFVQDEIEAVTRTATDALKDLTRREDRASLRAVRRALQKCRDEIRDLVADAAAAGGTVK